MDEGLLGGFAQGIKGAIQGAYDAEDRDFKRKEMAAKLAAIKTDDVNKANDQDLQAAKEGLKIARDESGRVTGFTRDGSLLGPNKDSTDKRNQILATLAGNGLTADFDEMGSASNIRRDPRLPVRAIGGDAEMTELRKATARAGLQKIKDDNAEQLSGKLQNAGDLNIAIKGIEKELGFSLDDYNERTGKVRTQDTSGQIAEKAVDLPGVSLPGIGRLSAYSGKARDLESSIAKVFNVELKDRSGAAVTTNELERIKKEFADGKYNTEAEKLKALKAYKNAFAEAARNIEAGFDPEIRDLIQSRGGFTSQAIPRGGLLGPDGSSAGLLNSRPAPGLIKPQTAPQKASQARSPQDEAALQWALANPNDSRASKILEVNGVKVGGR